MSAPLIVVPFAIELTVLVTTIAPMCLFGRFNNRPNLGIALWFTSFLIAFLSTAVALAIAIWSVFDTWRELESQSQPLWHTVIFSFAPWLILGLAGISMALATQRLEPIRELRKSDAFNRAIPSREYRTFNGVTVRLVDLPSWFAFTDGNGKSAIIYLSSITKESLNAKQLDALLWHELGHAKSRHNLLKSLVRLVRQLGGPMVASRVFTAEIDRLCELSADSFAVRHCGRGELLEARALFS